MKFLQEKYYNQSTEGSSSNGKISYLRSSHCYISYICHLQSTGYCRSFDSLSYHKENSSLNHGANEKKWWWIDGLKSRVRFISFAVIAYLHRQNGEGFRLLAVFSGSRKHFGDFSVSLHLSSHRKSGHFSYSWPNLSSHSISYLSFSLPFAQRSHPPTFRDIVSWANNKQRGSEKLKVGQHRAEARNFVDNIPIISLVSAESTRRRSEKERS